jgi:hypothetical protein
MHHLRANTTASRGVRAGSALFIDLLLLLRMPLPAAKVASSDGLDCRDVSPARVAMSCSATLAPPTTAAPRRLGLTSGPLARLLETCWVRGLDRFDGKTEAVRFQMSSEPRCATCLVTVRQHSIALIQTALGRPQETAQKPCYTPPGTRQRGAVGAAGPGRASQCKHSKSLPLDSRQIKNVDNLLI